MMHKIDLHTHSTGSPDGGITLAQYTRALEDGILDFIAITDHNTITKARKIHEQLGDSIIIGEEIDTLEGEIIGLFLKEAIKPGLSAKQTADDIKKQAGLVYIPHPFETVRRGLSKESLASIIDLVDIIEVYNGRAVFHNKGPQAVTSARINSKPGAASSDAHGVKGLASAYSQISDKPTKDNLLKLLSTAHLTMRRPPLNSLLYPKVNRLKKRWTRA